MGALPGPDYLQPADRMLMRRLLDGWVERSMPIEAPEWKTLVAERERELRSTLFTRKALSAIGLKRAARTSRPVEFVKREYNRIWAGNHCPKPLKHGAAERKTYLVWDDEAHDAVRGAVARPHLDRLMHHIALTQPRHVLEIGAGAGLNLFALASEFPAIRFEGIELSDAGVAVTTAIQDGKAYPQQLIDYSPRAPKDPTAYRRIIFRQASAVQLPFGDKSFDLVFSRLAIEQMEPIQSQVFAEIARVAARHVVMIEPFSDFAATPLQQLSSRKKNHFREPVRFIERFGFKPIAVYSDWPQKWDQGNGMVVARPIT